MIAVIATTPKPDAAICSASTYWPIFSKMRVKDRQTVDQQDRTDDGIADEEDRRQRRAAHLRVQTGRTECRAPYPPADRGG